MIRPFHLLLSLLCLCQCQSYSPSASSSPVAPAFGAPDQTRQPAQRRAPTPAYPSYPAYPDPSPATVPLTWRVEKTSSARSLSGGATHYETRLVSEPDRVRLNVVVFDSRRFRLRVLDQPDARAGGRAITHLMRAHGASAGVNGGFFTPEFRPLGLMISSGRAQGSFEKSSLISGMVLQLGSLPYLIWNREYQGHDGASDLLQGGPRLLDSGRPVAGLNADKKRSRSFIATDGGFLWAIGTTDACSLSGLAQALTVPGALPGMRPLRALNLDGGHSSALWMRAADGSEIARPGWSTVRNYLAIVPK